MASTQEQRDDDRAQRDLVAYAKTLSTDLYALLGLPSPLAQTTDGLPQTAAAAPSTTDLNKAWRRAALKYHPDKNRGDEEAAADRLDEARRAWEVLKDPEARAAYEAKWRQQIERKQRELALEGRRRGLAEALRRGEEAAAAATTSGVGVSTGIPSNGTLNDSEAKLRRLVEEGRKRRLEFEEAARRRREQERKQAEAEAAKAQTTPENTILKPRQHEVPELDRTVKVRWPRGSSLGDATTAESLQEMFSRFGPIESTVLLKDKKVKPSGSASASSLPNGDLSAAEKKHTKKKIMGTGLVVFKDIVGAHAAVQDAADVGRNPAVSDARWSMLDSVQWASGQAPNLTSSSGSGAVPGSSDRNGASAKPKGAAESTNGSSTASFTFSKPSTANSAGLPDTDKSAASGLSTYQITMMRLKERERQRRRQQLDPTGDGDGDDEDKDSNDKQQSAAAVQSG